MKKQSGTGASRPLKEKLRFTLYSGLTLLSPELSTRFQYRLLNGRAANLDNPESFSEKLSWLKLHRYADDPLVRQCADKLAVRDYVRDCGLAHLLNELCGVYDRVGDIPWDRLPPKFALKWNFGCGFNVLNGGSPGFDRAAVARQLEKWRRVQFWRFHAELQYRGIPPKLLCEGYLESDGGGDLIDYKLYCFNGTVRAILVIDRLDGEAECAVFMSPDWEYLSDIPSRYDASFRPKRPTSLSQMLEAAERLARPFPFVRVDFYEVAGRPVFGEMTFTPAAGLNPSECPIDGKSMGDWLELDGV